MDQNDTYIHEIIAKQLSSQISPEEAQTLETWLNADPANRETYTKLAQLWRDVPAALPTRQYNTAAAWQKVNQALQPAAAPKVRSMWIKYAAAAAVLLILSAGAWWMANSPSRGMHEVSATDGKIKEVVLADKSKVTLRPGATIRYTNEYLNNQRIVELKGDAFFDIAQDPGHPFFVKTPDHSIIEVLGTSFIVQTRDSGTIVIVASGKVKLGREKDDSNVILETGRKGVSTDKDVYATDNDNLNFLAWKTGILQFNDQSLVEILPQLADFYGKVIRIEDTYRETAAQQKATISFKDQSCDEVLHELQLLLGFKYRQEGDTIVISQ
ncbi:FecR domain-containing protein [Chitinophaga vietnamensis]|uniref:FecR domain-containing protein n=1 Tax=Chitinophaga vietnamensis TaxID=2593957 RepID=UPI0011774CA1|nr:FecR domain-containing protein [Chitinophaga vietnamensis]